MEKHYIHAYIGNGKGKTTAAVGLAVRAAGAGKKVLFVQLLKNGSSENVCLEKLGIRLITPSAKGFIWEMTSEQKKNVSAAINDALEKAVELICAEGYEVAVFDEILDAVDNGMLEVSKLLNICGLACEVILTGRKLPAEVAPICGYISEILPIAHPFRNENTQPRIGIEY